MTYPPVVVVDENDNEIGSAMLAELKARIVTHSEEFTPWPTVRSARVFP